MLTRRRGLTALLIGVALALTGLGVAHADGGCDTTKDPWCQNHGGGPGGGGGGGGNGGGGGGGNGCTWNGQTVPCQDPDFGYYMGNGCYWKVMSPPPNYPP